MRSPSAGALIGLEVRRLVRAIEIALGRRRITPRAGELLPSRTVAVPELDTGGAWRAAWRPQDPGLDPREPNGSESSGAGNDHGWSNCTLASGAMALAYHTHGLDDLAPWGGDLRHRQGDLSGGTDLYDLRDAWAAYGETFTVKSGAGWSAVVDGHDAGRAIVIQGTGNVPGSESFDGGHACVIAPESKSDGMWLFGDPLASGWQWISPSAIKTWAQAWQSSIAFGWSRIVEGTPDPIPPTPTPTPPPPAPAAPCYSESEVRAIAELAVGIAGDELVGAWVDWLRSPPTGVADRWDAGSWGDLSELVWEEPDPCDPGSPALWSRGGPLPPAADALAALWTSAAWDAALWRAALWRG